MSDEIKWQIGAVGWWCPAEHRIAQSDIEAAIAQGCPQCEELASLREAHEWIAERFWETHCEHGDDWFDAMLERGLYVKVADEGGEKYVLKWTAAARKETEDE